jgi:hypothetical protein
MSLAQLRDLPGASAAEAAWAAARASQPGWLSGPEAEAAACDATVVPIVTGQVDWTALDRLAEICVATHARWTATATTAGTAAAATGPASAPTGRTHTATTARQADRAPGHGTGAEPLSPATRQRLRRALLAVAADALSGPGGLAAQLRAALLRTGPDRGPLALDREPLASISLPLDTGPATETIPAHLRRAVTTRHPHCALGVPSRPACATSTTSSRDPAAAPPRWTT